MNNDQLPISNVYFTEQTNPLNIEQLVKKLNFPKIFALDDFVACKIHFGEPGNRAYLKPWFVKPVIDLLSQQTPNYFFTDTNTLYKGARSDAVNHLKTAAEHGYDFAPVIIADGLRGHDFQEIGINQKHFNKARIASAIAQADALLVLTHFKGHDVTGFGGAIKNLGMGCGSRAGKQQMHADFKPKVIPDRCKKDGVCAKWCPTNAINCLKGKVPEIVLDKCIGCGECLAACRYGAIKPAWDGSSTSVEEKIAEYALAAVQEHSNKMVYINYLLEISPNCDCYAHNDPPVVADIGILASEDPVAIDQASIDLVNQKAGKDIFNSLYPYADWKIQLGYAEEIGLGSRKYQLNHV